MKRNYYLLTFILITIFLSSCANISIQKRKFCEEILHCNNLNEIQSVIENSEYYCNEKYPYDTTIRSYRNLDINEYFSSFNKNNIEYYDSFDGLLSEYKFNDKKDIYEVFKTDTIQIVVYKVEIVSNCKNKYLSISFKKINNKWCFDRISFRNILNEDIMK
jgi:hypothetical protein